MTRSKRRAVVTGLGVVSPLGTGVASFWEGCIAGRSGIRRIQAFDPSALPSQIAGEVPDFDPARSLRDKLRTRTERFTQFALVAAQEAVAQAGVADQVEPGRLAVTLGNGSGGISTLHHYVPDITRASWDRTDHFVLLKVLPDMAAAHLAIEFGAQGPVLTFVAACVSSTQALGAALRLIQDDLADVVLAAGTEASITPVGMAGFCLLQALSTKNEAPAQASRPFDRDRDGFVLAEGAAVLVVEAMDHARARGASALAELLGYAQTCDAAHLVAPDRQAEGATRCIQAALVDAGIQPSDVEYVSAHGTGTPLNDVAETQAIKRALGCHAYDTPVSALKSMIGHTLGAAGALEAAAAVLTLHHGIIPPTTNLERPDPRCDLDYVPQRARQQRVATVLKNSFGFGGQNACLVLATP